MVDFTVRFFICNIFISGIIGILFVAKKLFKNNLTSRMLYHLWFLLLGVLAVPFLPFRPLFNVSIFSWLRKLKNISVSDTALPTAAIPNSSGTTDWMNEFTLSVSRETPSLAGLILFALWMTGILVMIVLMIKSILHLHNLKKSALPLQNSEVRIIYMECLDEMNITKNIPVYSTAFLTSPVIVGLLKPCIYLPIHLISDYKSSDMRYMLLHELQHYKHKDTIANYLMNLALVIYWFHPLVWYARKEMHNDREVACDTSVLKMLEEDSYEDYGNTLINFAEKVSLTPFPFTSGLGGTMKQMQRRIANIASYEKPTFGKQLKSMTVFMLTAVLLFGLTPILSTYAADKNHYQWNSSSANISSLDLSTYFGEYKGSFVLYDLENDVWSIYDMKHAALRIAPDSTYKIYDALFGLEEGVITPDDSLIAWNGENYPFEVWNADQDLPSAIHSSVNWYFQEIDKQLGKPCVNHYIQEIGYGNENVNGDLSSYWMESSLKISPIEQVKLLTSLYNNHFGFAPEHIQAVKDAICLSVSEKGSIYGKTGTGRVDGQDVNGWFIGYVETTGHTYFFASNIQNDHDATGKKASEISLSILSDMNIWK